MPSLVPVLLCCYIQPPSDMELLQRMGLSEEDQLRLALELSMQEQCVEDGAMDQQSSRDTADPETPTPDTQRPQTYKLVGIVNHIGKASSGGLLLYPYL
jgi:hypothetical protein